MKKTFLVLAFLTGLIVLLACCGDKGKTGEPGNLTGKAYDCKYFTMTLAAGWDAGPPTFGMVNVLPLGKIS